MLRYIIDGWNLIHKLPSLKSSAFAKRDFIKFIKKHSLAGSKNNKVTIVFDGKIDMDLVTCEKEFEITFSDEKSADEIIQRKVARYKNKRELVVVTDDRQVQSRAKTEGANILSARNFLNKVGKQDKKDKSNSKEISYKTQKEITDELRDIWLKDS